MKINFNRFLLSISLIFILILSLGLVSASNYSNDLIDITSDDNAIAENSEISDSDLGAVYTSEIAHSVSVSDSDLQNEGLNDEISSNHHSEDVLTSDSGNDFTDIQNLIDQANENDTVILKGIYSGDSKIIINKALKIVGDGSGATLDAKFLTQILDIRSPNVLIKNIRFANSYGMSVSINDMDVTIDNCIFENSINGELGSALSCFGDNVKILNTEFLNNIANKSSCHHTDGSAIYLISNNAVIDNCTFINNTGYNYETASSGGAIWLKGFNNSISNSIFINNSAISKFAWTLHGEEQTFLADGLGGAIHWVGNNGMIDNCSFIDCIAHSYGGAIYLKAVNNFSINNSRFVNNYAVGDAGAIYLGQNVFNMEISNCEFKENVALGLRGVLMQNDAYGGAIFASKFVENMSVFNSSFLKNYGDASIYYLGSNLQVSASILERPELIIENETLEKFLYAIKDSTLEECNLEINNFTLYSASGTLFEAIVFGDGSMDNNNWGFNITSPDEFIQLKLIKSNGQYISPTFWINMIIKESDSQGNGSAVPNATITRNKTALVSKDMTTTTVYSRDGKIGKYFTFRLTDSNSKALSNKRIIINFNGKDDYRTTDKNGYVKLQINLAKKGNYAIVACFLGDNDYEASFKSCKIKVNPVKAKLKVSNKKFKLKAKKKTLTAKFLSPKGKAIKGKKISFRINGKTYTSKTNSKGIATVKVKLNKRKSYKFTAKFAGDNTFKAISVKAKAVVK
ncbi:MAG: hypothetical protein J6S85_25335 [Methanobrevibacter sp.]|nr:hypothetical protein [Methanobrevibacter sp.]